MKGILLNILSLCFWFLATNFSYAIDTPLGVNAIATESNTVRVSWSEVSGAIFYNVYYGLSSGIDSGYANQTDITENTFIDIKDIESGKKYYFSVVAIDMNGDESVFSKEVTVTLDNALSPFVLEEIQAITQKKLLLTFSNLVQDSSEAKRQFKITNRDNEFNTITVQSTEIHPKNKNQLILDLETDLIKDQEYELVVLDIRDINNKSIEFGIDAVEYFSYMGDVVIEGLSGDEEKGVELIDAVEENELDLLSAQQEEKQNDSEETDSTAIVNNNGGVSGSEISNSDLNKTALNAAAVNSELPKTGPETLLLLLFAIVLSFLYLILRSKKV